MLFFFQLSINCSIKYQSLHLHTYLHPNVLVLIYTVLVVLQGLKEGSSFWERLELERAHLSTPVLEKTCVNQTLLQSLEPEHVKQYQEQSMEEK